MNKFIKTQELFQCDIGYLKDLFEEHEYPWQILPEINKKIKTILERKPLGFSELKPGVLVGQNVKIENFVSIDGPAIIGHNTHIRTGAYIRGNVITGCDCVLGNSSEFKNCILLDQVQVPHYNYVGDSILGNKAHMGAGSICSNLKTDGKNIVIYADKPIKTNMRKIGGFLGDGADVGCSCVINPGTIVGKNTWVYPLTSLRGVYPSNSIVKSQTSIVSKNI